MIAINMADVRVDVFTNSTPIVFMRMLHIPTGIVVEGDGTSRHRLRQELLEELTEMVESAQEKPE